MNLLLIDAIGPFFRMLPKGRKNWSKIPFSSLSLEPQARRRQHFDQIAEDLRLFARRVKQAGYNAVSLDDVPHLADHPWYEPEIRERIAIFRQEFRRLFTLLKTEGLSLYLTMDVLTLTPRLKRKLCGDERRINTFLHELLQGFLSDFPEVNGVILRIGESDGRDVKYQFRSELHIRTPDQLNRLLETLLPLFEREERQLILRTWTVGAYPVGDCIWHPDTLARSLDGIASPAFILSMKYGESDFFRYLPLNPHFFNTRVQKIIELQARREYEGCGEYPSFIGGDYEAYARELEQAENIVGMSVWCQTGGWVPFRRLAYLEEEALWTEINAFVSVQIFGHGLGAKEAVSRFCLFKGIQQNDALWELLQLSEEVVKELLYIPEYAQKQFFFRRVRIPPLLSVYWNTIFINHSMRKLMRHFVSDGRACIAQGQAALHKIERMRLLAGEAGLPVADIEYMQETFALLALAREYYFLPYSEELRIRLKKAKKRYKKRYPSGTRSRYKVKLSFKPFRLRRRYLGWFLALLLRRQPGYRLIDHLLVLHLLGISYRLLHVSHPKLIPKFARKRAMGLETIFK
ncbi:hypothetical protein JWJ90_18645 [Desulfobulbus rhabdoformis]|jgi:hypothetical protein|uniref:hypothetical protein n=1 Tax=Desulfobulbus rhabdoformis TaxID=34032 RepID=UPI001966885E|nr:hypothetical protein [Desulfobulbus rhabdoformis]MBM9616288.1 hypothetical protein [Desulfobulbus rhabdoformis]